MTNQHLNNWHKSEWYKEWEKLARDNRCIENQKPVGFWYYDTVKEEYIYDRIR